MPAPVPRDLTVVLVVREPDELHVGRKRVAHRIGGVKDGTPPPPILHQLTLHDGAPDTQPDLLVGHPERIGDRIQLAGVYGPVGAQHALQQDAGRDLPNRRFVHIVYDRSVFDRYVMARTVLAVMLVLIAAGGWVAYQHSYDIREQRVTITGGTQPLHGVLALPERGEGPFGLVVFVHGDGPIDATHDTFYRPIWEALAQAGFASLSWNKPGIEGAPGNWLDQSMDDRAREVAAAIDWARQRTEIDPNRIGLWGASQAGWVMPKVAAADPLLRFIIAVSPAINWLQQGRYNLLAELAESGHHPPTSTQLGAARQESTYLRADASYGDARSAGAANGMTPGRWTFAKRNYLSDASADLANVRVPVR